MPQNLQPPLWRTITDSLPEKAEPSEWYSVREIAPLVGLQHRSLLKHARDLWPTHDGHYRLNRAQAVQLIRRVCHAGRKLPGGSQ